MVSRIEGPLQRLVLQQLKNGGLIHGDPHGKNIFVALGEDGSLTVTLIDCGFCVAVTPAESRFLKQMLLSRAPLLGGQRYFEKALLNLTGTATITPEIRELASDLRERSFKEALLTALHRLDDLTGMESLFSLYRLIKGREAYRFLPAQRE